MRIFLLLDSAESVAGPAEDLLLLPDGVALCACSHQVRHFLQPPCFYGRTLSHTVLACCTCQPCWKCLKLWRQKKVSPPPKIHWFLPNCSSPYICSQASFQRVVKTKSDHHQCPISVFILTTSKSEAVLELHLQIRGCPRAPSLWPLTVEMGCGWQGGEGGDPSLYLLIPVWQEAEMDCLRPCTTDNTPPLSYKCLFLLLHLPLSRSKLDGGW